MLSNRNKEHQLISYGEFVWWFGVIENRFDSKKLGRLQVRVSGYHTDDKTLIPTEELFWGYPIQNITSAAMNGIGFSPTGLVEGTHVFGFFYDGHDAQVPIILGSLGGIPNDKNPDKGFYDPTGTYPRDDFLNEPDTNRLARNEKISETIVQEKKDGLDKNIPKSLNDGEWDERETEYDAKYPFNHTYESESGHIQEWDDTSGKERIHKYHRKGTFEEIYPDGTKVVKVVKDNYEIVHGDNYVYIKGDATLTIDGNANILVKGNLRQEVEGDKDEYIHGNYQRFVGGTTKVRSGNRYYCDSPRIDLNQPGPRIVF